jgi:multidrug transporter EmrE-like cation transporter
MKGKSKGMIGLLIYVLISASGLIVIKLGLNRGATLQFGKVGIMFDLNWILLLGICMYVISFLLNMLVMKNMELSILYPISAGLIYIIICVLSYLVLKEPITFKQIAGMVIILVGIIVMNLDKAI